MTSEETNTKVKLLVYNENNVVSQPKNGHWILRKFHEIQSNFFLIKCLYFLQALRNCKLSGNLKSKTPLEKLR